MLKDIANELGTLLEKKNKAYGDAFYKTAKIVEILYPEGVRPSQYVNLLLIVRILDKLCRIATDKDEFNEDPFSDIAGYGILGVFSGRKKHGTK